MSDYISTLQKAREAGKISGTVFDNVSRWLSEALYKEFVPTIVTMIESADWEALTDAFYQVIPFGTGGRRGPVGVGTNRMNAATIAESAQGVANKLRRETGTSRRPRVAVAYDTRLTSAEFTGIVAEVLAANDIEVCLFDGPRPTPQLSFTIIDRSCDAGIVISASHNPPEDNGFKCYWSDGGQVVPPLDGELIAEVEAVREVKRISLPEAEGRGLITRLRPQDDEHYHEALLDHSLSTVRDLRIVYSPIHGTGIRSVYPLLLKAGFKDVRLVENQKDPDGNFPNVKDHKPNPEITSGFDEALKLARAVKADVVMVSDPDADRLSVALPPRQGRESDWVILSGNRTSALLMHFIAGKMKNAGTLLPTHKVYTTAVSSPLMPKIARSFGLEVCDELLVGFKWIADRIRQLFDPNEFLYGSEESIGYMKGAQTRDKDAAVAALLFSELAAEARRDGRHVLDILDEIYREYGYYHDHGISLFFEGASGAERMARMMDELRRNPPASFGGHPVVEITDRKTNEIRTLSGELVRKVNDPYFSNVLIFRFDPQGDAWVAVRPSGTEPKIKFYFSLYAPPGGNLEADKQRLAAECEAIIADLRARVESVE